MKGCKEVGVKKWGEMDEIGAKRRQVEAYRRGLHPAVDDEWSAKILPPVRKNPSISNMIDTFCLTTSYESMEHS